MANGPGNLTEPDPAGGTPPFAYPGFVPTLAGVLRGAFTIAGRARRTDVVIYAVTALWLVPLALSLGEAVAGRELPRQSDLAIGALLALPFLTLLARRCHDSGRSGALAWLALPGLALPLARGIAGLTGGIPASLSLDALLWPLDWLAIPTNLAVVALCLLPGTAGANAHGPDPRSIQT